MVITVEVSRPNGGGSDYKDLKRQEAELARKIEEEKKIKEKIELENKKRQVVFEVGKQCVSKYISVATDMYKKYGNRLPISSKLLLKGNILLGYYDTYNDVKDGKWGSAVCLGIGFVPFPYGTVGSILCNGGLMTYRIINSQNSEKK